MPLRNCKLKHGIANGIILDEASRFLVEQSMGGRRAQRTAGGSEAPDVVVRIVGGTSGSIGTVGGDVERHVGDGEGGDSGGQLSAEYGSSMQGLGRHGFWEAAYRPGVCGTGQQTAAGGQRQW
jgi:hypothetical protein